MLGGANLCSTVPTKRKTLVERATSEPQIYQPDMCGCGTVKKKELSERWHSCECGTELDRDHNAALNILRLGSNQQLQCCRSPCASGMGYFTQLSSVLPNHSREG